MKTGTMCLKGPVDPEKLVGHNRVRDLRMRMNLTQQDFARLVGCTRTTINLLEKDGHNPKVRLAHSIANVCGVSVDYVLGKGPDTPYIRSDVRTPEAEDYYIVAYLDGIGDIWKSYALAYWNGQCFQKVEKGMTVSPVPFRAGQVTDWMILPRAE